MPFTDKKYSNNQLTKKIYEDGSTIVYGYSSNTGLLNGVSRDNGGETTRFEFNQGKNEFSIIHPSGFMHYYQFDDLGRKTILTQILHHFR